MTFIFIQFGSTGSRARPRRTGCGTCKKRHGLQKNASENFLRLYELRISSLNTRKADSTCLLGLRSLKIKKPTELKSFAMLGWAQKTHNLISLYRHLVSSVKHLIVFHRYFVVV